MKKCQNCGEELPQNAKFCLNCGTPVPEDIPEKPMEETEMPHSRTELHRMQEEQAMQEGSKPRSRRAVYSTSGPTFNDRLVELGTWMFNNPVTSLLSAFIAAVIIFWMNKIVGIVLLLIAVVVGFFYANRVGSDDQTVDLKLKKFLFGIVSTIGSLFTRKPKQTYNDYKEQGGYEEDYYEDQPVSNQPVNDNQNNYAYENDTQYAQPQYQAPVEPQQPQAQAQPMEQAYAKPAPKKHWFVIITASIVMLATYFGGFTNAAVAGYGTPATLLRILQALNHQAVLLELLAGPIVMILGAFVGMWWLIRIGSVVNVAMYIYTFYLIYQNEMQTSGLSNTLANISLGISGYVIIAISVILLLISLKNHKR